MSPWQTILGWFKGTQGTDADRRHREGVALKAAFNAKAALEAALRITLTAPVLNATGREVILVGEDITLTLLVFDDHVTASGPNLHEDLEFPAPGLQLDSAQITTLNGVLRELEAAKLGATVVHYVDLTGSRTIRAAA